MLATRVICPNCSHHLKTSKPLTVGHRVLCSHCGRSFAVPPELANGAVPQTSPPTPQPATLPRTDATHARSTANVEPAVPPARSSQAMWIGLVFGGLLLVMGASAALALYFATRKSPEDAQSLASTSTVPEARTHVADPSSPDSPTPSPRVDPSPAPSPEPAAWLPPEVQAKVNKALDQGVHFLEKTQRPGGGWGPRVGLIALPGLTLLECGVAADDSHIQKAVQRVRQAIPQLNQTYDLALTILFLDRLGDPQDKKLIQTCALRLVAGQTQAGGWNYPCRILKPEEERDLLTILQQTRPTSGLDLFAQGPNGSGFVAQGSGTPSGKSSSDGSVESKLLPEEGPDPKAPHEAEAVKKALGRLPPDLCNLAALQPPKKSHNLPPHDASDNSNTQFAILGLWAASRHGLPLERSLALAAQRFRKSEARKGGWSYHYAVPTPDPVVTPSMTGAGLLALAVGHGLAANHTSRPRGADRIEDLAVEKGFNFLSQNIGKPLGWKKSRAKNRTLINMYFMWTTERVGVLFNRREIGGKDWYSWGVELLLDHQNGDGSWMAHGYPGASPTTDTCFALLFLKRANLAKDLTQKLEFFMDGKTLKGP